MSNRALVYRCPPNTEHKAAQELREAGIRAYVPRDRASKRNPFTGKRQAPAPGYVFADRALMAAYAKHVRAPLGIVNRSEMARLYLGRQRSPAPRYAHQIGTRVTIQRGPNAELHAIIAGHRERFYYVDVELFGRTHRQTVHEQHIKRYTGVP
jgi:hypothetical protein